MTCSRKREIWIKKHGNREAMEIEKNVETLSSKK
jgi:hypothetical protein